MKYPLFEFATYLLPSNLEQPMHSQSALTELPSPNLAPFLLLGPVEIASYDFSTATAAAMG